jgi:hypothetical protein
LKPLFERLLLFFSVVKSAFVDVELTQKNLDAVQKAVEKVGGTARLQTTRTFKIQVNDEKGNKW